MSLVSNILIAAGALLAAPSGPSDDEVCREPGACRTKHIEGDADGRKFVLYGEFVFEPPTRWIKRAIYELPAGAYVHFNYERADESVACALSLFHLKGPQRDLDYVWWMFVGIDVESDKAQVIAEARDEARHRRSAVLKFNDGKTRQLELRGHRGERLGQMWELTTLPVAPTASAINTSDPDMLACHVRPPAA